MGSTTAAMDDEGAHPVMDLDAAARRRLLAATKRPRVDRLGSTGSSPYSSATSVSSAQGITGVDELPLDLPAHLRDHVVSVRSRPQALEDALLPPIEHARAPMRIPLLPENMKMEPTPGINSRRETKRVIVCGAGIIGLTTCYYLAKQGHEVLCVEKERSVGTQVSLCNGAFLDPALYSSWSDIGLLKKGIRHSAANATAGGKKPAAAARFRANNSGAPAARAAGEDDENALLPPEPNTAVRVPVRSAAAGGAAKWPARGKPMKVEMSALRDTKFWKWGLQFWMNSKKTKSNEHGRAIRELGFYSMLKLRELQAQTKKGEIDMDQTAQGTLEVFSSSQELEMTLESDRSAHLEELGMDLQPLNATQAANLEPALKPGIYGPGAVLSAFGTNGDVHKMCQSLYRLCLRQGVMFRFNTEVAHILTDKTTVIALQTRRGSLIEGDEFVLALGNSTAAVAKRAGIKLAIYPVKGYVLSVPVNDRFRAPIHNIYAGGHALVSPLGRVLRISGGVDFGSSKKSDKDSKSRYDWLLSQAKALFPEGYMDVSKMTTHTCWRPVTADDVPLIGRTKIRNLYVNAGHGSKGWTLSFGSAALIADEISGLRPQLDMSKFAPDRFGFFG